MPALDTVQITLPCSALWDEMSGDDRSRFCGLCRKPVYNLSAMTCAEAQALLDAPVPPCVRLSRLADGRVRTLDRVARVAGIAGVAVMAACATHPATEVAREDPGTTTVTVAPAPAHTLIPEATEPVVRPPILMGTPPAVQPPVEPPPVTTMGAVSLPLQGRVAPSVR